MAVLQSLPRALAAAARPPCLWASVEMLPPVQFGEPGGPGEWLFRLDEKRMLSEDAGSARGRASALTCTFAADEMAAKVETTKRHHDCCPYATLANFCFFWAAVATKLRLT